MKKKRVLYITLGIILGLLLIMLAIGFYYVSVMKNTLNEVTTQEGPKTVFSVYVLSEDEAQNIGDTFGYSYGVNANDLDKENLNEMFSKLEATLGEKPNTIEYDSMFSLVDALKEQKSQAIILNEAYKESISEAEGYEWTETEIRKIESFKVTDKQENTNINEAYEPPEDMPESFIAYISGIDTYGGISARSRSDVNIIAVVNTKAKKILMVATPRDYYVDFSVTGGKKDKLTHAGIYGVNASIDALERLYDIDVDYYLRINFSGFVNLIDALGGVEVYSDYDFTVENIKEYHKGYNQLTGIEALAFARERYSFARGDYQRAKNQMEVIKSVINKATTSVLLKNYNSVMNTIPDSFETNMPQDHITALVKLQIKNNSNWDISSYTVDGNSSYETTFSMPGRNLYVIIPNETSVNQAKSMINEVKNTV